MWCETSQFPRHMRRATAACCAVYAVLVAVFFVSAEDDGRSDPVYFRAVSLAASASLLTVLLHHWTLAVQSRWRRAPGSDQSYCSTVMAEALMATILLSALSHVFMAFGVLPATSGFGGSRCHTARFAEWGASVPLLVLLMHATEDVRCVAPSSARVLMSARALGAWVCASPEARVWRALAAQAASVLAAVASVVWRCGPAGTALLVAASCRFFLDVFFVLDRLMRCVERRVRCAEQGPDTNCPNLLKGMVRELRRERAQRSVLLCASYAASGALGVAVAAAGCLRLASPAIVNVSFTVLVHCWTWSASSYSSPPSASTPSTS